MLTVLVLNILFCTSAAVMVFFMRIRARLVAPPLPAGACRQSPPMAELQKRFNDRECTALLFIINLPIFFSCLRVCTLGIPPSLQFCPPPTTPAARRRRSMSSLCCCCSILFVAVAVVLVVVKPWNSFKRG